MASSSRAKTATSARGNGPNSGCEAVTCKFSCANAAACDDGNACNGVETCDPVTATNGGTGHKCNAGTPEANGTACGTGKVCVSQICQSSSCGDGVIDPRPPGNENCDPPGSVVGGKTCDSKCHLIDCGDGRREDTEQCDDGNVINLDGCDSKCKFEQDQRANSLTMSFKNDICSAECARQGDRRHHVIRRRRRCRRRSTTASRTDRSPS